MGENTQRVNHNQGWSTNWSVSGRPLMRPEEILTMSGSHLIVFVQGMPPIWARRVVWYSDKQFNLSAAGPNNPPPMWWLILALAVALVVWALAGS